MVGCWGVVTGLFAACFYPVACTDSEVTGFTNESQTAAKRTGNSGETSEKRNESRKPKCPFEKTERNFFDAIKVKTLVPC
jgi:hypothetical protein